MISDVEGLSELIKKKAHNLGFDLCGIAPSRILKEHETKIRDWCSSGMNADMTYLCRNPEKRIDPESLLPGARSVIVTGLNYYSCERLTGDGAPVISRYAFGTNYHDVIQGKLHELLMSIKVSDRDAVGRSFVDSAPLLEKAWAKEAGLGWPGRHSVLINNKIGSFFFIGVLIVNISLNYDEPFAGDHCGSCRLCIDSCPTGAINENRTIDARKCISYLTIENKYPLSAEQAEKMEGRLIGCDKCQEVCPWNRNAVPNINPEFRLSGEIERMTLDDWRNLSKEKYRVLFRDSVISRIKYDKLLKNISVLFR
jgi:epoxyqueuosine reductase